MRELLGRLTDLDPEASAALRVVGYFDALVNSRAGVEATVRAAAAMANCPAGLMVPGRRARIRIEPDGQRIDGEPHGLRATFAQDPAAFVWLESSSDNSHTKQAFDQIVLERFATTAQIIIDRTTFTHRTTDSAAIEVLLDPGVDVSERRDTARLLGLSPHLLLAVGCSTRPIPRALTTGTIGSWQVSILPADQIPSQTQFRAAFGTTGAIEDLPSSYQFAQLTLRLTTDPGTVGATTLTAEDVMGLLALSEGQDTPAAAREVALLEQSMAHHPWSLQTLTAIAAASSLREAAATLHLHHSTLQVRVERLSRDLGWDLATPAGRARLTVALALRLFRINPAPS